MDIWNELTDATNKDMAIDEMRKKYENTYLILIKPDSKEELVYYKGFHDGFHLFKDELNVDLKIRHETNTRIICAFPERRLFNSNKMALEFIRLPARQYRRGICKDNVRIYSPVRQMWNNDNYLWTMETLKHAIFPVYPVNIEEAVQKLQKKECVSIALNAKFMVSLNFATNAKKDLFFLFYCNCCIGSIESNVVKVGHPLFKQEVLDNISLFKPYRIEL